MEPEQRERIRAFRTLERAAADLMDAREQTGDSRFDDAAGGVLREKSRLRRTIMENGGSR